VSVDEGLVLNQQRPHSHEEEDGLEDNTLTVNGSDSPQEDNSKLKPVSYSYRNL